MAAAPGWPPDITSSSRSDLSNSGEITFWREGLLVFDSNEGRFSQLNDFPGGPPPGGTETNLNSSGEIVLNTGTDVYLATPRPYGDYDNDGDVDADDLARFETTYGDSVAIGTAADGSFRPSGRRHGFSVVAAANSAVAAARFPAERRQCPNPHPRSC